MLPMLKHALCPIISQLIEMRNHSWSSFSLSFCQLLNIGIRTTVPVLYILSFCYPIRCNRFDVVCPSVRRSTWITFIRPLRSSHGFFVVDSIAQGNAPLFLQNRTIPFLVLPIIFQHVLTSSRYLGWQSPPRSKLRVYK